MTNRKERVRKDFDRLKEYSVDVSNCSEEGKKAAILHSKIMLGIA